MLAAEVRYWPQGDICLVWGMISASDPYRPVEVESLESVSPCDNRKSLSLTARLCALVPLLLSASAIAGGDFGEIRITSFQTDPEQPDVFELRAVSQKELFDWRECNQFTVKGSFDSERWRKYKRPMSESTHQAALEYLQKSSVTGGTVAFGTIGAGLKKLESCVFESKGLFMEPVAGKVVVFSVHFPI